MPNSDPVADMMALFRGVEAASRGLREVEELHRAGAAGPHDVAVAAAAVIGAVVGYIRAFAAARMEAGRPAPDVLDFFLEHLGLALDPTRDVAARLDTLAALLPAELEDVLMGAMLRQEPGEREQALSAELAKARRVLAEAERQLEEGTGCASDVVVAAAAVVGAEYAVGRARAERRGPASAERRGAGVLTIERVVGA